MRHLLIVVLLVLMTGCEGKLNVTPQVANPDAVKQSTSSKELSDLIRNIIPMEEEAAYTVFLSPDRPHTANISKGDHIDVSATWEVDSLNQAHKSIYILEDIEVLDVRSLSNKNRTKAEKEGTYLVLQLTSQQSIVLKYFKERAHFFDVERRPAGKKYKEGGIRDFVKSPEQKLLDKWLGTWRTSYKQSKPDLIPDEKMATDIINSSRILAEEFVQEIIEYSDKTRGSVIFTYDSRKKYYRRWQFSSAGKITEFTGTWDEDRKAMKWTSVGEPSSVTTSTNRFVDDDNAVWDVVSKDITGKVISHMEGKRVRIQAAK